jgi:hypothetical protein
MTAWYNKYLNLPYKHLGQDPETGIDCFNLCTLILKQECGYNISRSTSDFCNIVDDDWYDKVSESLFDNGAKLNAPDFSWKQVAAPEIYDILVLNIGSTNVANHCAMYIGDNKLLQIMIDRPSWVSTYGKYYKQYTLGIYRWNVLKN